jgi:hypothetical protein
MENAHELPTSQIWTVFSAEIESTLPEEEFSRLSCPRMWML